MSNEGNSIVQNTPGHVWAALAVSVAFHVNRWAELNLLPQAEAKWVELALCAVLLIYTFHERNQRQKKIAASEEGVLDYTWQNLGLAAEKIKKLSGDLWENLPTYQNMKWGTISCLLYTSPSPRD